MCHLHVTILTVSKTPHLERKFIKIQPKSIVCLCFVFHLILRSFPPLIYSTLHRRALFVLCFVWWMSLDVWHSRKYVDGLLNDDSCEMRILFRFEKCQYQCWHDDEMLAHAKRYQKSILHLFDSILCLAMIYYMHSLHLEWILQVDFMSTVQLLLTIIIYVSRHKHI